MSRLDSAIRRLTAQRDCLNHAAGLIAGVDGVILELGLGNGRTFDHLRQIVPERDIYVFERQVAAHPDCVPGADRLILGDVQEGLVRRRERFAGRVALTHIDLANGDTVSSDRLFAAIAALLRPLMAPGGVIVSERELHATLWARLPVPDGVPHGRYWLYRAEGPTAPGR
jgi:hypothetical protein